MIATVLPEPMAGSAFVTAMLVRTTAHEAATRDASNTTSVLVMVTPRSRTEETEIYHEGHEECTKVTDVSFHAAYPRSTHWE
jgi:hypothetical protein